MRPKPNRGLPTPPQEPDTHSQSTLALSKCMESLPLSSINSSFSEASRSLYKAVERPKRVLDYDWQLKDLELRELKLQLREKHNELLELRVKQENELATAQKLANLQAKAQEVTLKEQLQETTELTKAEHRRLRDKAAALEAAIEESASPNAQLLTERLEIAAAGLEQELDQAVQTSAHLQTAEQHYRSLADRTFRTLAQLRQTMHTLFSVSDSALPPLAGDTEQRLQSSLAVLEELKTEAHAYLFEYLAYRKRP